MGNELCRNKLDVQAANEPVFVKCIIAVLRRGCAKHAKGKTTITEAGEKALAEDDDARRAARSAQRPRRR